MSERFEIAQLNQCCQHPKMPDSPTNWIPGKNITGIFGAESVPVWFVVDGKVYSGLYEYDPELAALDGYYNGTFSADGMTSEPITTDWWQLRVDDVTPDLPEQ